MSHVMYLRKSRVDIDAEARGEPETLARHRSVLLNLAARNGHSITREYPEVVSGETIAQRPEMRRLLADIASGEVEGVYVMDVERLARGDAMDQGRIAQVFLYSNTQIITPQKTYRPDNESDAEYLEFGLFMSRREYKTINRRLSAGREQSVKEGKYICSRPAYGYRKTKLVGEKGFTLTVHPDESEVVRWVFAARINGNGLTRISNQLIDMGVSPGAEGQRWTPTRVHRMLTNEVYIGKIRWGRVRTRRAATSDGIKKKLVYNSDYELHDGLHEAIIDADTFYKVQNILQSHNIPMRRGMEQSNPLSGILRCKLCGHFMRGVPAGGRQAARVKCAQYGCPTVQNYMAPVEEAMLDTLRSWLQEYILASNNDDKTDSREPAVNLNREKLSLLEKNRAELLTQKDRLCDLLERDVYDEATFKVRFAALQNSLKSVESEIHSAKDEIAKAPEVYCDMATLAPRIEYILSTYDSATPAQRNDMLRKVISVAEYAKTQKGNVIKGKTYSDPNTFTVDIYPRLLKQEIY